MPDRRSRIAPDARGHDRGRPWTAGAERSPRGSRALPALSPRRRCAGARAARRSASSRSRASSRGATSARASRSTTSSRSPRMGLIKAIDRFDRRPRDRVLLLRRADDPRGDQALLPRPHVGGARAARPAGAVAEGRPRGRRARRAAAPPAVGRGDRRGPRRRRGGGARGAAGRRRLSRRVLRRARGGSRRRRGRRDARRLDRHRRGRLRSRRGARDARAPAVDASRRASARCCGCASRRT